MCWLSIAFSELAATVAASIHWYTSINYVPSAGYKLAARDCCFRCTARRYSSNRAKTRLKAMVPLTSPIPRCRVAKNTMDEDDIEVTPEIIEAGLEV
jgi:hypothetical protein